jgi:hypothetical protein
MGIVKELIGRPPGLVKVVLAVPFLIVWIPLWLAFMIVDGIVLRPLMRVFLVMVVAVRWRPHGTRGLFVHSDSPNWRPYLDRYVIPAVKDRMVLLNWSDRKNWNRALSGRLDVMIFRHWAFNTREQNYLDFNPMAVVFVPWYSPKALRFFYAFKQAKHGNLDDLTELEEELFTRLDLESPPREYFGPAKAGVDTEPS